MPVMLVGLAHWTAGSWWRVTALCLVCMFVYQVAERSGLITWLKALLQAGSTTAWAFSSVVDMAQQLREQIQTTLDDFNEYSGWQVTMWDLQLTVLSMMVAASLL